MESILPGPDVSKVVSAENQKLDGPANQPIINTLAQRETTFRFMVFYRWLALGAALLLTIFIPNFRMIISPLVIVTITIIYTLILTLASRPINHWLRRYPLLLGLDLGFVGGLLALTGGWHSPYYLYALSPILAAAFFFLLRGALISATVMAIFFAAGLWWQWVYFETVPTWEIALTYLIGFYLIGVLFSYPATLLRQLRQAHRDLQTRNMDLSRAHQELQIIHGLTRTMQSASDPSDIQEQLLQALVGPLGFSRAIVALRNPIGNTLSSWLSQTRAGTMSRPLPHVATISVRDDEGKLVDALLQGEPQIILDNSPPSDNLNFNEQLALGPSYAVFPLVLRRQSLGIVAITLSNNELTPGDRNTLISITDQAAVALGNVQLCIDRTKRLTIEEERNRIAREIHDNVSQSLFGIVYALDSCIKLLPEKVDVVKTRLVNLHPQAIEVMDRVRESIYDLWETEVTANHFQNSVLDYTQQVCRTDSLQLVVSVDEDFEMLDPTIRRTFLRIAQESMANVVKHAKANQATIAVVIEDNEAVLLVVDNGQGIAPTNLEVEDDDHHFGLLGMHDRLARLGGALTINHRCDRGTTIKATLPLNRKELQRA